MGLAVALPCSRLQGDTWAVCSLPLRACFPTVALSEGHLYHI